MRVQKQKKSIKRPLVITLSILLLLVVGWMVYAYLSKVWPFTGPERTSWSDDHNGTNSINYNPPTDQETSSSQDAKKNLPDDSDSDSSTPTTPDQSTNTSPKKSTNVGISYADIYNGKLEIRAFTSTVIEGTGTCTATVVMKGMESMRVTKSSKAFIDATSTVCEPIYVSTSELHSGTWKVTVAFSSPDHEGTSETVEVKVP